MYYRVGQDLQMLRLNDTIYGKKENQNKNGQESWPVSIDSKRRCSNSKFDKRLNSMSQIDGCKTSRFYIIPMFQGQCHLIIFIEL